MMVSPLQSPTQLMRVLISLQLIDFKKFVHAIELRQLHLAQCTRHTLTNAPIVHYAL
jgi:hypothetical protein